MIRQMAEELAIRLLGGFGLRYRGRAVHTVATRRLQSLLAYLVLHREAPQPRDVLAPLFWPASPESQARTNLRQLLHRLRRALPDAERFLELGPRAIRWRPAGPWRLDVAVFEQALARAGEPGPAGAESEAARAALEEAVAAYTGELLPGCWDDWLLAERERLHQACAGALERLVQLLRSQGEYDAAIHHARRLVRHDRVREAAHRELMELLALRGERGQALRAYHACAEVLERELGAAPGPALRALHARLLAGQPVRAALAAAGASSSPAAPGAKAAPSRAPSPAAAPPFERAAAAGPQLVGRERELRALRGLWSAAAAGRAQLALVLGEAGIGKTRLADELRAHALETGGVAACARSFAAEGRLAYGPVIDWLRAPPVREALPGLDPLWRSELAHLLPELQAELPAGAALRSALQRARPAAPGERSWERRRLFEAAARAVLAPARPLLLQLDDLQWSDEETLAWLHFLLRFAPAAPLLVLATARIEDLDRDHPVTRLRHALVREGRLSAIELGPLDAAATAALAAGVAGRAPSAGEAAALFRETGGNPLFVVETVRARMAAGDAPPAAGGQGPLPPGVQAVIASRLAALSAPARALAGLAAALGRGFSFELLARAGEQDEDTVARGLDELWQRRIIRESGAEALPAYDFRHDRIREVAYAELSPAHRRLLHRRAAEALQAMMQDGGNLQAASAEIASHYELAGLARRAARCYLRAAHAAQRVHANAEAAALLGRGLRLLAAEPPSAERTEQQLAMRLALGVSLVALQGYGAPAVEEVYEGARRDCECLGRAPSPPILRGLAIARLVRGRLGEARALGEQLLVAAGQRQPLLEVEARYVLGVTAFWCGEFARARQELQAALARYEPARCPEHLALYSQDAGVICRIRLAWTLWMLGEAAAAAAAERAALERARRLDHPYSLAYVLNFATMLAVERGAVERVAALAAESAALCEEHRLGFLQPMSGLFRAWARAARAGGAASARVLRAMQAALERYRAMGQELYLAYGLALLGATLLGAGRGAAALGPLEEALELAARSGQHFYDAELWRLRGAALRGVPGRRTEARNCLRRALRIARSQGARPLVRRAQQELRGAQLGGARR